MHIHLAAAIYCAAGATSPRCSVCRRSPVSSRRSSRLPGCAGREAQRPNVYRSIGVKPLVNARGTFTIISGSLMLPEVRAAMDGAARHYVHLDELADAVGARLATLTGAEWGLVRRDVRRH